MQVFRLVDGGRSDKLIAFDSLPERLVAGLEKRVPNGIGKYWIKFAPEMFIIDYKLLNKDIERWSEISAFVRRTVDKDDRLLDKLEDMAVSMSSKGPKFEPDLDPDDIPVIKIPVQFQENGIKVKEDKNEDPQFECPACMKTFKSELIMKQHAGRKHKNQLAKEKVA